MTRKRSSNQLQYPVGNYVLDSFILNNNKVVVKGYPFRGFKSMALEFVIC